MLTVIGGPMFSGKTTWLLNYEKILPKGTYKLFKPTVDTRYEKHAYVSHDGVSIPALNLSVTDPHFPTLAPEIKTILIDEVNFFDPSTLLPIIEEQLQQGRNIVAAGLLYDFAQNPFGATFPLSQKADKYIELFARCDRCGKKASESYRKVTSQQQFLLGSSDIYGACCKTCYPILSQTPQK